MNIGIFVLLKTKSFDGLSFCLITGPVKAAFKVQNRDFIFYYECEFSSKSKTENAEMF